MGSKTLLQSPYPSGEPLEDKTEHVMLQGCLVMHARLRRIADALQVHPSDLYNPPNAIAPARGAGIDDRLSIGLDRESEALLAAYGRISDPAERQRLLNLVQAAAERS